MSNAKRRHRRRRRRGTLVKSLVMFNGQGLLIYRERGGSFSWRVRGVHVPARGV